MVGVMKTTTEEDEFIKRNTDCVYFLASPLTCKKGAECEYRHSDIARINPRDCWYWLNGNCLNPKCAFRHPPLDGFLGAEDPTPVGPSVPQAPVKQDVACIFFQKGFCLKGHLCPFLHGPPNVFNNKPVQPLPPNPVTNPSKISSVGLEKPVQEQKFTKQEIVQKPVEFTKQVPRVQSRNGNGASGVAMEKKVTPSPEEPPRYRPASVFQPPVMNDSPVNRSNNGVYETHHVSDNEFTNGKDDEYSREPTPGFDVLVDTELGESEYYPNEQQFGERSRGPDFDFDVDRDMYNEQCDFNHYNKEGYSWEDNRESSNFEKKRYPRNESPNQFDFDKSDLRHRILKQRRGNNSGGLRSVVSRENPCDGYTDRIPRRNGHHDRRHDRGVDPGQLSSRLRGRIKIPGRSMSPGYENGSRVEREIDMGRQYRSRYSSGRQPNASSNHNRFRDRIKGRASDDFNNERRDYRSSCGKSQNTDDGQTLGKRKYPRVESQQSEVNVSFEGPKPLSEILKRKRGSVICSVNNEEDNNSKQNNHKERKEILPRNMVNADNEKSNKAGSFDENALLDQDVEAYDHNNGDYDYEQLNGEDYNLEEGEEEEEDGNEIEKKESEVYS